MPQVVSPSRYGLRVKNGVLEYACNTLVTYRVRGIHTKLNVIWDWEAPAGAGDTHFAVYKGSVSRIEARQSKADAYKTELYVVPERRGEGLGRALLEAAIEAGREAGAEVIDLNTSEDDTAAIALYESAGFTNREGGPEGPRMRYYERDL